MAQLLVRNLTSETLDYLKKRAKTHHRSLQGEVKSILETIAHAPTEKAANEGWPEKFFEEVVGKWPGEPLERAPQGEYEERDEWP